MKISTVRSLLVLLDLALVGGIVGVVYLDMAVQQDERRAARRSYQQETLRRLAAVSVVAPKASTDQTYDAIGALNFAGTPPTVEGPKVPEQPKIPTKEWRPLGDLLTLAGAERHGSGVESPSFILYRRTGDKPIERKPITPASRPGGRSNDPRGAARNRGRPNATRPRTVPKPSGPQRRTYSAWLGDAIELSDHEIAIVKDIRTVRDELLGQVVGWKVVFDYNGKEVELEVVGDTPRSGKSKAPVADKPVNPDPGTWLGWSRWCCNTHMT